jgi:hypothetical protein
VALLGPDGTFAFDFLKPHLARMFFHPPSRLRWLFGLVPGEKGTSEVGGVVGGVIGSNAEVEGELEESSVRAESGISELEEPPA